MLAWPIHTLLLALGCTVFVLGLFDRKPALMILGVVIAAGVLALY